jgi:class 3 adenylate cyclase
METEVLQNTLNKIGGLLAIGFGEAGSKIIAQNMRQGDDVDPLLPGQKVIAIFGFCDIRRFTDATEVLQEGVMLFVNEIGEIVHGVVDRYQGAANKNIGDAFLLVWKFDEDSYKENPESGELELIPSNKVSQLCDMSMISFLKIIGQTKRSRKMRKYANHSALNRRMPNYEVKMGFGLHQGWAIEGALGSFYKIDASYLSPNVNMSSKLEETTKAYDSPVLISGDLHRYFTDACKRECRQIDNIVFSGQQTPTELFTCDVDFSNLDLEPYKPPATKQQARTSRVKVRLQRNAFKESVMLGEIDVSLLF